MLRSTGEQKLRDGRGRELIAAGADIKLLQTISGHASATMTLDTYGHLMNARVSEAAVRYDPLRERAVAEVSQL